ncbi:MAG TPA: ABC-F family ATP-binding cassette domain-containing protein [bacterium]|nr:ABC-F family ATP-binding cassette domain-containing protein [bacterium]
MPILTVQDITKTYAGEAVFSGVTFSLEPRERVALIGRNGSGKTTLLRLLAGLDEPDRGRITLEPWARCAYLAQAPSTAAETPILAHVLTGAADVQALERRARELEHLMADPAVHDDADRLTEVMAEYASVRDHFEHAGGFALETAARSVLTGLGFRDGDFARSIGALSGGWRVRAELARALLMEPDLLLLDEPTNHLDLDATEWLEAYLQSFPGAMIVVSHDRYLLDTVTGRTLELDGGAVTAYPGSYTAFAALKSERVRREAELYERQQEEVAKLQAYIRRYKAGNRATQAKSREKMLARVRSQEREQPRGRGAMRVRVEAHRASGRLVARLTGVGKRYDDRMVLSGVTLQVHRGDRIGLLGGNGAGKTTLLRMIAGVEEPTEGVVALGTGVQARYAAQEATEVLDAERTVLDEILGDRPMTPEDVRTYLGRFLFSGDDVYKRVRMLSGGERQRLSLAKLLLDRPNFLLLDEPTNHLDIPSREALEGALLEYTGTIILATHDRYLLERIATRIVTVEDGAIRDFQGTYRELRRRAVSAESGVRSLASGPRLRDRVAAGRGDQKAAGGRATPVPPTFDEVAAKITAAEREMEDAGRGLSDPETYRDPERVRRLRAQYDAAAVRLEDLYRVLGAVEEIH